MKNLHVVFTMNPSSDGLKDRAATRCCYSALITLTIITVSASPSSPPLSSPSSS